MSPVTYAAKVDANHPALRQMAARAGYVWIDTYRQGAGCPDAWICSKSGRWIPLEIKSPGKKLTDKERQVFEVCQRKGAPYEVVRSWEELAALMEHYDSKNGGENAGGVD